MIQLYWAWCVNSTEQEVAVPYWLEHPKAWWPIYMPGRIENNWASCEFVVLYCYFSIVLLHHSKPLTTDVSCIINNCINIQYILFPFSCIHLFIFFFFTLSASPFVLCLLAAFTICYFYVHSILSYQVIFTLKQHHIRAAGKHMHYANFCDLKLASP